MTVQEANDRNHVPLRHVCIIIPARDEAATIASVVQEQRAQALQLAHACTVVVCDNGSVDGTAAAAQKAGAVVVVEPRAGYGRACLQALRAMPADTDVVLFCDGDGADDPMDQHALLTNLMSGTCDLVIGSRVHGAARGWVEKQALTSAQRLGNALASTIMRVGYQQATSDLGPFRAITQAALTRLRMDDQDFGWTVQMQARAARAGLRTCEVPVHYRRRQAGRSKVSGNIAASVRAGQVILSTLWRERRFR